MLPYIVLWLATAAAAYYLLRWCCKKFATWTNADVIIFASLGLIFGPVTLLVALVWAGFIMVQSIGGFSAWLDRPSKW
jgi:hypothetical protein